MSVDPELKAFLFGLDASRRDTPERPAIARASNRIDLIFSNDVLSGPGCTEVLTEDSAGNPIDLFQPERRSA